MTKIKAPEFPEIPEVNDDDLQEEIIPPWRYGFELGLQHQRLQHEIIRLSKMIDKRQHQLKAAEDAINDIEVIIQTLELESGENDV